MKKKINKTISKCKKFRKLISRVIPKIYGENKNNNQMSLSLNHRIKFNKVVGFLIEIYKIKINEIFIFIFYNYYFIIYFIFYYFIKKNKKNE